MKIHTDKPHQRKRSTALLRYLGSTKVDETDCQIYQASGEDLESLINKSSQVLDIVGNKFDKDLAIRQFVRLGGLTVYLDQDGTLWIDA